MKTLLIVPAVAGLLAAGAAVAADAAKKPSAPPAKAEIRDWSKVDTNKDGLVSPEEMEAHLKAEWASKK